MGKNTRLNGNLSVALTESELCLYRGGMLDLYPRFLQKKHLIWDWNGTLLNDIDLCVRIISQILSEHELEPLTKERYRALFRFPVIEYYREIGFDFERVSFEKVARQFIESYDDLCQECELFEGAIDLLQALKKEGKSLYILSAAREVELRALTERLGIFSLFEKIYGLSDHYAVSKVERGKQLLSEINGNAEDMLLIGDTDHDVEVGRALQIDVLLLGDGHQHSDRLKDKGVEVIASRYAGC